ncbi:hypothetical protein V8E36_006227 [Tilletia maclaganii]
MGDWIARQSWSTERTDPVVTTLIRARRQHGGRGSSPTPFSFLRHARTGRKKGQPPENGPHLGGGDRNPRTERKTPNQPDNGLVEFVSTVHGALYQCASVTFVDAQAEGAAADLTCTDSLMASAAFAARRPVVMTMIMTRG